MATKKTTRKTTTRTNTEPVVENQAPPTQPENVTPTDTNTGTGLTMDKRLSQLESGMDSLREENKVLKSELANRDNADTQGMKEGTVKLDSVAPKTKGELKAIIDAVRARNPKKWDRPENAKRRRQLAEQLEKLPD